jgi:hypothetical protein
VDVLGRSRSYECFLAEDTALPFLYMPDCLEATTRLMMAPQAELKQVLLACEMSRIYMPGPIWHEQWGIWTLFGSRA